MADQGKGGALGGVWGRVLRFDVRQRGEGRALLHEPAFHRGRRHAHLGFTFGRDLRMQQLAGEQVSPQARPHQHQGGRDENADEIRLRIFALKTAGSGVIDTSSR